MELVDGDTALFLKQVALWRRAEEAREQRTGCVSASRVPTGFLLESPQGPATYLDEPEASQCPSFFTFPELMSSVDTGEIYYIQFDQGRMGHTRRKPTGLVSNFP